MLLVLVLPEAEAKPRRYAPQDGPLGHFRPDRWKQFNENQEEQEANTEETLQCQIEV